MNPNESPEIQSPDRTAPRVESLLKQMPLRGPSDQLDAFISNLPVPGELNERSVSAGTRFGWTAILVTATAAMLAGVWLGYCFMPGGKLLSNSNVAASDLNSPDASRLTPATFNVRAFNLLHGHSQRPEFGACGHCHQHSGERTPLKEIFRDWFYGDENFFEAHPDGLADCSKCHVMEHTGQQPIGKDSHQDFDKLAALVNCSQCHQNNAEGFGGFESDWRTEINSSEG